MSDNGLFRNHHLLMAWTIVEFAGSAWSLLHVTTQIGTFVPIPTGHLPIDFYQKFKYTLYNNKKE